MYFHIFFEGDFQQQRFFASLHCKGRPKGNYRIIHVNVQGLVALNVVLSHNSLIRSSRYIAAKMAKIANKVVFFCCQITHRD